MSLLSPLQALVQIFDIGPLGRFPGECRGNNNCNWVYDEAAGTLTTFHGLCLATKLHTPAPPAPAPAPPPPPFASTPCTADLCFAWTQGSSMVLQRAPQKSAVYGSVKGGAAVAVAVTVTPSTGAAYTVPAVVTAGKGGGGNATWKAFLRPTAAGGNYTILAKCTSGCSAQASVSGVTFGDVGATCS